MPNRMHCTLSAVAADLHKLPGYTATKGLFGIATSSWGLRAELDTFRDGQSSF